MTIKERKEREKEEKRKLILSSAREIISTEGIDKLSIRKIAKNIDYSPALIYNYFQDKEDILNNIMQEGYMKIIETLNAVQILEVNPEENLKQAIQKYIEIALNMPEEYMSILLNKSPNILEYTSVLFNHASNKRQAIDILCKNIKLIYGNQEFNTEEIELDAQVVWTATYGLIIRLIIEKDIITEDQENKLIENHIKLIINGITKGLNNK